MTTLNTLLNNGTINLNTNNILSVGSQDRIPIAITFNDDGTKMFIHGYLGMYVNVYPRIKSRL